MTVKLSMKDSRRWVFTVGVVVAAFYMALYFNLFVLCFGSFPKDLAAPTAGFVMGWLIVFAGSLYAPKHRLITAVVLWVLSLLLYFLRLHCHFPGLLAGGLVAVALVGWLYHPGRTARSTKWVSVAVCVAILAFAGLVYARHVDWPASPDSLPITLAHVLDVNTSRISAFYRYDLRGFIDTESLWYIEVKPDVVAHLVSSLGLKSTHAVPPQFWEMPPHYWPRDMPMDGQPFQSPGFTADTRGSDGSHYFLLHDERGQRVFVWVKDNF